MQPLNRLQLNPVQPSEASSLQMENELLRHEVSHLRARLAVADPRTTRAPAGGAGPAKPGKAKPPAKPTAQPAAKPPAQPVATSPAQGSPAPVDIETVARNAAAYDDLVWLLGRLDGSPAGPLLRRVEGFRTLRSRYLPEPPA